jgi:hypothetical protein
MNNKVLTALFFIYKEKLRPLFNMAKMYRGEQMVKLWRSGIDPFLGVV